MQNLNILKKIQALGDPKIWNGTAIRTPNSLEIRNRLPKSVSQHFFLSSVVKISWIGNIDEEINSQDENMQSEPSILKNENKSYPLFLKKASNLQKNQRLYCNPASKISSWSKLPSGPRSRPSVYTIRRLCSESFSLAEILQNLSYQE